MRPLPFLYPSVLAGSLRSYLGKLVDPSFPPELVERLRSVAVHGPLPATDESLYFPTPNDAVFSTKLDRLYQLAPLRVLSEGCGTDLPVDAGGLVGFKVEPEENFKPGRPPAFWSNARMTDWLLQRESRGGGQMDSIPPDVRWHVQVKDETYAAMDQRLFQTSGLAFPEGVHLAARFQPVPGITFEPGYSPLGGERRLAHWAQGGDALWKCPTELVAALAKVPRLRLVLATPGLFAKGFIPSWLGEQGAIPGTKIKVALKGVCVDRWRAISGYSLDRSRFGRKPVRRLAPAGAVYFLERLDGDQEPFPVESVWLKPVSDLSEDIHRSAADGFGLGLWGTW